MPKPLLRIPYTEILPSPTIAPSSAASVPGAVAALRRFFAAPLPSPSASPSRAPKTLLLTGAGLSVASGLPDYRGVNGTYRVNKTYRPIFHHEFLARHEARQRYWARSFLGWSATRDAAPNAAHHAVRDLGRLGLLAAVATQNVDSFHPRAHPDVPTIELHGCLRTVVCTACRSELDRDRFQAELARLNPRWAAFLHKALRAGALGRGIIIKTNPDGDVDLPDAPYTTFRYPPCPRCLESPSPALLDGDARRRQVVVETDADGAWAAPSTGGILKPNVVMFGENIAAAVRDAAEAAVDAADRLLVVGTSLATYSAWRLARQAKARGMPIAVVNAGGVRGEDLFFADLDPLQRGELGVRTEVRTEELLPALVEELRRDAAARHLEAVPDVQRRNSDVFKDMLS